MSGGQYHRQHLLTQDDELVESQMFPRGRYDAGGFLKWLFDTALVIEIRKRVRLRNGYRQKGDSEIELEMPDTHRTWTFKKLKRMPFS